MTELRSHAAYCARLLLDAGRKSADVRTMMMEICSRLGHVNIADLADDDPQSVIDLWEAVEMLDEGSYDNVMAKVEEAKHDHRSELEGTPGVPDVGHSPTPGTPDEPSDAFEPRS